MLHPNEKIDSWVIVVETTEGRTIRLDRFGINLPDGITQPIDEIIIDAGYPVTWMS